MVGRGIRRARQIAEMSETVEEPVERLVVDCQYGSVVITPASGEITHINAEVECDEDDPLPTVSWTVESRVLRIDVHVPEKTGRGFVRLAIAVPRNAAVEATSALGSVEVHDRSATVELHTSAGGIRATNVDGDVTMRSSAGTIKAADIRGESILLETQAGSIVAERLSVKYARIAGQVGRVSASFSTSPQHVEAATSIGKLTLAVPRGTYGGNLSGRVRVDNGICLVSADGVDHQLDVSVTLGTARITSSDS